MFGIDRYNYRSFSNDVLLSDAAKTGFGKDPSPAKRRPISRAELCDREHYPAQ